MPRVLAIKEVQAAEDVNIDVVSVPSELLLPQRFGKVSLSICQ